MTNTGKLDQLVRNKDREQTINGLIHNYLSYRDRGWIFSVQVLKLE